MDPDDADEFSRRVEARSLQVRRQLLSWEWIQELRDARETVTLPLDSLTPKDVAAMRTLGLPIQTREDVFHGIPVTTTLPWVWEAIEICRNSPGLRDLPLAEAVAAFRPRH